MRLILNKVMLSEPEDGIAMSDTTKVLDALESVVAVKRPSDNGARDRPAASAEAEARHVMRPHSLASARSALGGARQASRDAQPG
jgi:hypothetical protein